MRLLHTPIVISVLGQYWWSTLVITLEVAALKALAVILVCEALVQAVKVFAVLNHNLRGDATRANREQVHNCRDPR